MIRATAPSLRLIGLSLAAALLLGLAFAAVARADDMGGMNMTPEEMQNMSQPTPVATAPATTTNGGQTSGTASGHDGMAGMPGMGDSSGGTNWLVIGAAAALVAGGTGAAIVIKRRLRKKMLAGKLATAGAIDA